MRLSNSRDNLKNNYKIDPDEEFIYGSSGAAKQNALRTLAEIIASHQFRDSLQELV